MNNTFTCFASAYLVKSGTPPSLTNPVKVGGVITTEDRDIDGEIISKSSDFSYFEGGFGKIKYEHGIGNTDIKEPYSFIGSPIKLIRKGRETHFIGELYPFDPNTDEQKTPQRKLAKAAYGLLLEMEEHNKRHPEAPQRVGWSIEGDYIEKDNKTGLVKARVANVVLTTKPRNMKTYAQIIKSLSVGYGMTPSTQVGFGALRKESLDGSTKNSHLETNSKGAKKMKKYKADVYNEAIKAGKSEDEARKEANEFEANQETEYSNNMASATKSLSGSKEKLTKSIEFANNALEIEISADIESHKMALNKSLNTGIGEEFDAAQFLIEEAKAVHKSLEIMDALTKKVDLLAKSIVVMNEASIDRVDSALVDRDILTDTRAKLMGLRKGFQTYVDKKSRGTGFTTLTEKAINDLYIADNNAIIASGPVTKNDYLVALDALAEENKVSKSLPVKFETNIGSFSPEFILTEKEMNLVKSKHSELHK